MYGFKTLGWLGKPHAGLFLWVCQICGTCAIGLFQAERDNTLRSSHHRAAVLTAIAIPVFTTQLERSREATDVANVRSAYAAQMADFIATGSAADATVSAQQKQDGWQGTSGRITTQINGVESFVEIKAKTDTYTISLNDSGVPTIS